MELAVLNHFNSHSVSKLLAIDDLADRRHSSDILVDSNYYGPLLKFVTTLVPDTCQLLGHLPFMIWYSYYVDSAFHVLTCESDFFWWF